MKLKFYYSKKIIIAFFFALFLGTGTAFAYDFSATCPTGQTLYFNVIDAANEYVEITHPGPNYQPWPAGAMGAPGGEITLPKIVSHNGVTYTVTAIGDQAFDGCVNLTGSLTIPNTITSIGYRAFGSCGFTGSLSIPYSVTTIGEKAFYYCVFFTGSLSIPNSVTTIGNCAFQNCHGFTGTLTIGTSVTSIGEKAFYDCTGFTGSLTIPNSVTTIGEYAFQNCHSFTGTLTIGTSVTTIGKFAFVDCTGFTHLNYNAVNCGDFLSSSNPFISISGTLNIGNNVVRIPAYMLYSLDFTGSLTIPNSVTSIGKGAFWHCMGLTHLNFNAVNCEDFAASDDVFDGFNGTLSIGNDVTRIPAFFLQDGTGLTGSLTIPNAVTSIGKHAFYNCNGFEQVIFKAANCSDVGTNDAPFGGCGGTLNIDEGVQHVPSYMFLWGDFTELTIPTTVTSIGKGAFKSCTSLTKTVYYAINCSDVTSSDKPFEGCGGRLSFGHLVQRIPAYMFYQCTDFTGPLHFPNSITSIGERAFTHCSGFSGSLTLPNSLTTIGDYAFCNTSFSGALTLPNALTSIGQYAFYSCTGLTGTLTIPNFVTSIGQYAFYNCPGLSGPLSIGNAVTTIGGYAFTNCGTWTSMTVYPETPPTLETNALVGVSTAIPVYVKCASLAAYQTALGWTYYSNMQCGVWTVNAMASPAEGGTVTGGGEYTDGAHCVLHAYANDGYMFLHWKKNGEVLYCEPTYGFDVTEEVEYEAVFMSRAGLGPILGEGIGSGTATSQYLPSSSYHEYGLSQQIYTADELGGSCTITSISFFDTDVDRTRNYDVYLKHSSKTTFNSATDWISVSSTDKVFSGSVAFRKGYWTTIVFDTPFQYNGTSNLALVIDDNTGNLDFNPRLFCRVYDTQGNQAIYVVGDDNNYNPSGSSSYTGTLSSQKNWIMLNRQAYNITAAPNNYVVGTVSGAGTYSYGETCTLKITPNSGFNFLDWTDETGKVVSTDAEYSFTVTGNRTLTANCFYGNELCSLKLDLFDSYGDGWNGNYLVVNFWNTFTQQFTIEDGASASFTLPVKHGGHIGLSWTESDFIIECAFTLSNEYGEVLYMTSDLDGDFEYAFDMNCDAVSDLTYVGDYSDTTDFFLPTYSLYRYSLTQQIYTPEEIGTGGYINAMAFYNDGDQECRNIAIYLKTTEKTTFDDMNDWIGVASTDRVFNGNVTLVPGTWTPITFQTPFYYDGDSNLLLVVDDNTNNSTNAPHMACRVYKVQGYQAIRAYSNSTNYDPYSPSVYNGQRKSVKNQLLFDIDPVCPEVSGLTVDNITSNSADVHWAGIQGNYNVRYRKTTSGPWNNVVAHPMGFNDGFENGLDNWTLIDADGDGNNWFSDPNLSIQGASAHGGSSMAFSYSWTHASGALNPDNYLVTPQVELGGTVTFWASAEDLNDAAEHFGIAVSTNSNTDPNDFTMVQEWTMTAKGGGQGGPRGNRAQGTWYQYTVDLSAYDGETGYIALRHFGCTDQFALAVDDFSYGKEGVLPDGITLEGLDPATTYEVQVQGICAYGLTEWSESATFTTMEPAAPTNLTVDNITCHTADVHWTGDLDSYNVRYRAVPDGSWVEKTVDFSAGLVEGFENGFGDWTLIDEDGDGYNWRLYSGTSKAGVSPHGGNDMVISESWIRVDGVGTTLTPNNFLVSPQVELGGTVTFWARAANEAYSSEHFGIAVSTNGNTNPNDFILVSEWTMVPPMPSQDPWYQWSADLSAYAGQTGYIAIRHFNCAGYRGICIDDIIYGETGVLSDGITLNDLEPATTYEVQVQGIYPGGLTEWSEAVIFPTAEVSTVTQTIELSKGWNWFSMPFAVDDPEEGLIKLQEALGENGLTIKDKVDYITYEDEEWGALGDLEELVNEKMYMIQTSAACTIELEGTPANPTEYTINITKGWNWIGFPSLEVISIEDAFADFEPAEGDIIKGKLEYSKYEDGDWGAMGDLEELTPGQGYMYYSNSTEERTLIFQMESSKAKHITP